ncbi:MAG: potassium channel family protein [Hyphomicrobiaceae bacterium]
MKSLRDLLRSLYHGASLRSRRFRMGLLIFDVATLVFFVIATTVSERSWFHGIEIVIALLIAADLSARYLISTNKRQFLKDFTTWIDVLIVFSLIVPIFFESLVFLRVLRAMGLLRSFSVLRDLRTDYRVFREHEEIIQSGINLVVFIFAVSAIVYVVQHRINGDINNFVDALYFTVATLTTTGFGDITLKGDHGHLLSVLIMVIGVALFLRLLQTLFRPSKVVQKCQKCGLGRHEHDASHCKHCGEVIYIETEGGT